MSYIGSGGSGDGSYIVPGSGSSTVFTNLLWTVQSQTDALIDPADTPTTDTSRLVYDAAGNVVLYTYSTNVAAWKGVQLG